MSDDRCVRVPQTFAGCLRHWALHWVLRYRELVTKTGKKADPVNAE